MRPAGGLPAHRATSPVLSPRSSTPALHRVGIRRRSLEASPCPPAGRRPPPTPPPRAWCAGSPRRRQGPTAADPAPRSGRRSPELGVGQVVEDETAGAADRGQDPEPHDDLVLGPLQ